jgi:anti-sigma regulatory factor (Ser/Thr protein kinase)
MSAITDSQGSPSGTSTTVELDLPLHHRHASTVRVVAASLAADAGFTVDEIDDLRLGVNEAVSMLADVDHATATDARLRLTFDVASRSMTVRATRRGVDAAFSIDDVDDLAMRIVRAVVDEFQVDEGGVTVTKHAVAADDD